ERNAGFSGGEIAEEMAASGGDQERIAGPAREDGRDVAAGDGGLEGWRPRACNRVEPDAGAAACGSILEKNGAVGREADGAALGGDGGNDCAGLEVDDGERGVVGQADGKEAPRGVEGQTVARVEREPGRGLVRRVEIQLEAADG